MECARHPARTFPLLTAWLPVPLQRSPNWFPVLRGGFHYYFLDLLLAEPFRQPLQLLGVAPIPASLQWVFVYDFDISHNHRQLLFMDIDSRYPIRHKLPGGSGERAGDYIKQGLGLSTLPPGRDNAHLFALSRTLRIRQAFGLSVSTDYSISPLPTVLDYCQTLSDFHVISRARSALQ